MNQTKIPCIYDGWDDRLRGRAGIAIDLNCLISDEAVYMFIADGVTYPRYCTAKSLVFTQKKGVVSATP